MIYKKIITTCRPGSLIFKKPTLMRKMATLSLIICFYSQLLAQDNYLAELQGKLSSSKDSNLVRTYNLLGNYYSLQEEYDSSEFYYNKVLSLSNEIGFPKGLCWAYGNLGRIQYVHYSNFEKAIELYLKGLEVAEKNKLDMWVATSYLNMAHVYGDQKKIELGLETLFKASDILKRINDSVRLAPTYLKIGEFYNEINSEEKAILYNEDAISICRKVLARNNNTPQRRMEMEGHLRTALFVKASRLKKKKDYHEALAILQLLTDETKDIEGIEERVTYINFSSGLYNLMYDYKKSLLLNEQALALLKEDSISSLYQGYYENMSKAYAGLGLYAKAYENHLLYKQISDTILNKESLRATTEMQTKYEMEKKDEAIVLLNKEKKSQRTIIGLAIGVIVIALALLVFAVHSKQLQAKLFKQQRELEKNELQKKMAVLEQMALRAQMNPHFIFNSLTSIQNFVYDKDGQTAQKFISSFSRLIRQTLDNSGRQLIPLNDEIKYLDNYLQLEQMRLRNKFQYTIHVQESIDKEMTHVPSMVLQPFVENSIKHGVQQKQNNDGLIKITVSKNGTLSCVVEDNGIGRQSSMFLKDESDDGYESKGMDITKSRIETINKIYETSISLNIEDLSDDKGQPAGTRVKIDFPVDL